MMERTARSFYKSPDCQQNRPGCGGWGRERAGTKRGAKRPREGIVKMAGFYRKRKTGRREAKLKGWRGLW